MWSFWILDQNRKLKCKEVEIRFGDIRSVVCRWMKSDANLCSLSVLPFMGFSSCLLWFPLSASGLSVQSRVVMQSVIHSFSDFTSPFLSKLVKWFLLSLLLLLLLLITAQLIPKSKFRLEGAKRKVKAVQKISRWKWNCSLQGIGWVRADKQWSMKAEQMQNN